jgi:hypothetical protein
MPKVTVDGLEIEVPAGAITAVTLHLFQGPFIRSSSGCAARWMLKQVQHDEGVREVVE